MFNFCSWNEFVPVLLSRELTKSLALISGAHRLSRRKGNLNQRPAKSLSPIGKEKLLTDCGWFELFPLEVEEGLLFSCKLLFCLKTLLFYEESILEPYSQSILYHLQWFYIVLLCNCSQNIIIIKQHFTEKSQKWVIRITTNDKYYNTMAANCHREKAATIKLGAIILWNTYPVGLKNDQFKSWLLFSIIITY